jgi:hypothetical protein
VPIAKWVCTHYVNGLLRRSGESELSRRAKAIHIIKIGLAWAVMCFLILGPPLHGAGCFSYRLCQRVAGHRAVQ